MKDLTNIPLTKPIEPYINADGWYAQCERCWNEIEPHDKICPYCLQLQDWSWFGKYTKKEENQ